MKQTRQRSHTWRDEENTPQLTRRTRTVSLFRQTTDRLMTTPVWGRGRTRICPPLQERKDQLTNERIRRQSGRALVSAASRLDTDEMHHEGRLGEGQF
jgi:hypothetical protein